MFLLIFFFQQTISLQQQVQMLQNEADKLRSDNVKLYEKIKFLQTYPTKVSHHAMMQHGFTLVFYVTCIASEIV